jgi:hypothetical protein
VKRNRFTHATSWISETDQIAGSRVVARPRDGGTRTTGGPDHSAQTGDGECRGRSGEGCQTIGKYNLLAVPVVEQDGSVVGFVTVDDVIDVLIEEQTEDILRMAAVEPGAMDKPYFDNPIFRVVRKRIGWLLLLFVCGGNANERRVASSFENRTRGGGGARVLHPAVDRHRG